MSKDFSKLGRAKKAAAPTDPIRIFESLPSLAGTPNDLWRGQYKALSDWHAIRSKRDTLISLNTGAGKTIVGLLIAQSLVNEGIENVIYLCSTIDLVEQTSKEASQIGIRHTKRVRKRYSNDDFEIGEAFCITTYSALFNGHSSIRNKYFPGAIIFDDAHVAESLLRDAFTLRCDVRTDEKMFQEISNLFRPHFRELGISGRFDDSLDLSRQSTAFVAPNGLYQRAEELRELLRRYGAKERDDFKYAFAWLEDKIHCCSAIFTRGVFELTPPFLPSLALDIFEQKIRRIYLSATLQSHTEFVRAFGRLPDQTITPSNDAGNGERLILDGRKVKGGFGPDFCEALVDGRKAIIAVPSYQRAGKWKELAEPPEVDDFSDALEDFRSNQEEGAFALVSRVDGIDLPHETCRIMVIDGVPSATSLLERFQWEWLRMDNVHATRVANRLAQLFGRINRGRNDYGAFLLEGEDLSKWIGRERNLALLPPLLQQQILVGREIQSEFALDDADEVIGLVDQVLGRDTGWLDYYQREVKLAELDKDQRDRFDQSEPVLVQAALSEAKYASAMWSNDIALARRELEKTVDKTATHDARLAGWHAVWLGAAYDLDGDRDSARREYSIAMQRLNRSLTLPGLGAGRKEVAAPSDYNEFGNALKRLLSYSQGAKFEAELRKLTDALALIDSDSSNEAEAGVRQLGEILGFTSTRPDNDEGTGPDVLWCDDAQPRMIGFELKTRKDDPATYYKKEISQGHDHIEWMNQTHAEYTNLGLLYVGPDGVVDSASNPSTEMGLCLRGDLRKLRDRILALIEDLRKEIPLERPRRIADVSEEKQWDIEKLIDGLRHKQLLEM